MMKTAMPSARRSPPGILAVCICLAALVAGLAACSKQDVRQSVRRAEKTVDNLTAKFQQPAESAQPAQPEPAEKPKAKTSAHRAKAAEPAATVTEPEPAPTQQELVDYLRDKLLALSPSDGINDNVEVSFDPSTSTLTVLQPTSRCDHYLGALDAGNITWDTFDPSDQQNPRPPLLRLTTTSVRGKKARFCLDVNGLPEEGTPTNRVRLLFSLAKAEQIPGFQEKMAKAVKDLIVLSGGAEQRDLFPDSSAKPALKDK